jgi:hypothetical protein
VVTDRRLGLGFCVGSGRDGPGPLLGTRAWATGPGGQALPLVLASLPDFTPWDTDLGAIFLPPPADGGVGLRWLPGRYVFAVERGAPRTAEHWFAVEVLATP